MRHSLGTNLTLELVKIYKILNPITEQIPIDVIVYKEKLQ
jgi:hypothetical protein